MDADQFAGCLLGLATGDALGAPHEGGPLERLLWRLIGRTSDGCLRWTDDTQMALDLARSLLDSGGVDADALARRFAAGYRWSRGYGPGTARVLRRIRRGEPWQAASESVYAGGSYGNGAAMRAPVLALFYADDRAGLLDAIRASSRLTHAHPLGIEGAVLVGLAAQALLQGRRASDALDTVQAACTEPEILRRLDVANRWLESGELPGPKLVARELGNDTTAAGSCPTAVYVALRHLDVSFEEMMQFTIALRGDVDTVGAMAGALWGIANSASRLPAIQLEMRDDLASVARRLFRRYRPADEAAG